MPNSYFAMRIDAQRLVVAEVDYLKAAALLDAGLPVFLGTAADLVRLALHLRKDLVTFTCGPASGAGSQAVASFGKRVAPNPVPAPAGRRWLAESPARAKHSHATAGATAGAERG